MDIIKKSNNCFKRWHIRYLVSTELYIVEPWEKNLIYVIFAVFFGFFVYFNYSIILNGVSLLR